MSLYIIDIHIISYLFINMYYITKKASFVSNFVSKTDTIEYNILLQESKLDFVDEIKIIIDERV